MCELPTTDRVSVRICSKGLLGRQQEVFSDWPLVFATNSRISAPMDVREPWNRDSPDTGSVIHFVQPSPAGLGPRIPVFRVKTRDSSAQEVDCLDEHAHHNICATFARPR